ncbi:MAG TPA: LLM class flavin-dependent oxidoreductase [Chloroflexia bacterium]|nr:LLM class flavin-dependent oxidoreductase [Chloroflexia bacterium]
MESSTAKRQRFSIDLGGAGKDGLLADARAAEEAGFETVWAPELYRSAFVPLAAAAVQTSRLQLGTGIVLAFTRSPLITALSALDLDELSEGRFVLGLGTGVKRLNEAWHNVANYGQPAPHMRETVEAVRLLMSKVHTGEPISYKGEYFNLEIKGFQRPFKPYRPHIPIFMAGIQEKMVETAGQVADGLLGHPICSPLWIKQVILPNLESGLKKSGRERSAFTYSAGVTVSIAASDAPEAIAEARRAARSTIAFYGTVKTYDPIWELHGYQSQIAQIRRAFVKGDFPAMLDAVTDEMVEVFTIAGTVDYVRRRLAELNELCDVMWVGGPVYYLPLEQIAEYRKRVVELVGAINRG